MLTSGFIAKRLRMTGFFIIRREDEECVLSKKMNCISAQSMHNLIKHNRLSRALNENSNLYDSMFEKITTALQSIFPNALLETTIFRSELSCRIKKENIREVSQFLKDELGFDLCVDICGADRFNEEPRFEVIYNLMNLEHKTRVRLNVWLEESKPHLPSVVSVWPAAEWYERETYDMFGIVFVNHPDLRRIYMPEDFEYFPMRKEFPLVGVPGSIPLPEFDERAQNLDAGKRYNQGQQI